MEQPSEGKPNGALRDLPMLRDSSVSPMTRSPALSPTQSRQKLQLNTVGSEPRLSSPLRTEQKLNGSGVNPPKHSGVSKFLHAPTSSPLSHTDSKEEFPFTAIPGTEGPIPTNDLIHRIDHASLPPGAVEAGAPLSGSPSIMISRAGTGEDNFMTPVRRSVSFARGPSEHAPAASHSRQASWDGEGDDGTPKEKDTRLFSKLKALASPAAFKSHGRSLSSWTIGSESHAEASPGPVTPGSERDMRFGEDEGDADAEESGVDGDDNPVAPKGGRKRRHRFRRHLDTGSATEPTTPSQHRPGSLNVEDSPIETPRPLFSHRRATTANISDSQKFGYSEDEGRDRLTGAGMWRRPSAWVSHRGASQITRHHRTNESAESERPSALRRLTAFASTRHDSEGSPIATRRFDRSSSMVGNRLKAMKMNLKLYSRRERIDHAKSAELVAELLAGAPAALFLASMFLRDEKGARRVPVLLEQLKLKVTDKRKVESASGSHTLFRIELEYGSSVARMKWTIERTYRDMIKMHLLYKQQQAKSAIQLRNDSERSRQPKLPKGIIGKSQMRELREVIQAKDVPTIEEEEEEQHTAGEQSGTDLESSRRPQPSPIARRGSSLAFLRQKTSLFNIHSAGGAEPRARMSSSAILQKDAAARAAEKKAAECKKLESYLTKMITWVMFHPSSNRLCRWLELSALGVRLAAEGGYHGKEGHLYIQKMTGLDSRSAGKSTFLHSKKSAKWKWFLVRHSYIVCVDSPDNMNIYDVYLVDHSFNCNRKSDKRKRDENTSELADRAKDRAAQAVRHHRLTLNNSERIMKLEGEEKIIWQFKESIDYMTKNTIWSQKHRFDSFAPVRENVYAQFLVDGRDYMWNVSRAISMARDVIYIHDWWLSPELYMRRPAAISQRWRLDRLLKRKAEEGVKIYIIVYRNVESAIPIDSEYTKFSLLDLSDNVYVQRSPNQIRQGTFFWSHHEKICVVDHCVAFCGGVDLCFGRWDTPSHTLTDDKGTGFEVNNLPKDADHCQLWPGKDYSNPRVLDFYSLDKPYEEMYDRHTIPRMPWHDIGMQIVGQPARDLSRHFVQRWNYVLRQRTPSRPTPMLLPPPDFAPSEIESLGLNGTCEVQILRSSGMWSLGLQQTECSIMNAYVEMIRTSEHFMYMENQFFITTCHNNRVQILNLIGDAIVERIIRAYENGEAWRAIIVIPLVPGYQNTVDVPDGYSVRLIMQCQWWSINRGNTSIFGRLRERGIEPSQYIEFYSLRTWGQIGPQKALVTEQLYIHAKIMVVDDRLAIIGSANINERSLLGDRDSEIAAIVRDTDMVESSMAGQPYMVGRFAHDLRMRLMREHLGLDVDEIREDEEQGSWEQKQQEAKVPETAKPSQSSSNVDDQFMQDELDSEQEEVREDLITREEKIPSFNHDSSEVQAGNPHMKANKKITTDPRVIGNRNHIQDVDGLGHDKMLDHAINAKDHHARDTVLDRYGREVLVSDVAPEGRGSIELPCERDMSSGKINGACKDDSGSTKAVMPPPPPRMDTSKLGLTQLSMLPALPAIDDTDIGGPPLMRSTSSASAFTSEILDHPVLKSIFAKGKPLVDKDCMRDPLNDDFYQDIWLAVAENNTKLFRAVFKCMPDNQVRNWADYKAFMAFSERFAQSQGLSKSKDRAEQESKGKSGPPGNDIRIDAAGAALHAQNKVAKGLMSRFKFKKRNAAADSEKADADVEEQAKIDKKETKDERSVMGSVDEWAHEQDRAARQTVVNEKQPPPSAGADPTTTTPAVSSDPEKAAAANGNSNSDKNNVTRARTVTISEPPNLPAATPITSNATTDTSSNATGRPRGNTTSTTLNGSASVRRRRATTGRSRPGGPDEDMQIMPKEEAQMALEQVQGALVCFPYDWLEKEEQGTGAWMWSVDSLAPLEIYT